MSLFPFVLLLFWDLFFLLSRQTPTAQHNCQNRIVQSTQAAAVASLTQKKAVINRIKFFLTCIHLKLW